MKYFAEKEAEKFLKDFGFEVVESYFVNSKFKLKKALKKVGLPCVMKVFGKNIVHKKSLQGVKTNIRTLSEAFYEFNQLKKIKGSQGVLVQKKFSGKEFLFGVKQTPEFKHVLVFGSGGSKVEEKKDLSFRICPLDKNEITKMIKETQIGKNITKKLKNCLQKNLLKISELVKKYPNLSELDINPFTFSKGQGKIIDARIVWDK